MCRHIVRCTLSHHHEARLSLQALPLVKALTETCAALGRHCGPEAMMWGCDLDPGNLGALGSQLSVPPGAQPCHQR